MPVYEVSRAAVAALVAECESRGERVTAAVEAGPGAVVVFTSAAPTRAKGEKEVRG